MLIHTVPLGRSVAEAVNGEVFRYSLLSRSIINLCKTAGRFSTRV